MIDSIKVSPSPRSICVRHRAIAIGRAIADHRGFLALADAGDEGGVMASRRIPLAHVALWISLDATVANEQGPRISGRVRRAGDEADSARPAAATSTTVLAMKLVR
ncbi:MAG: hypothetical protein ACTHJP_07180 [Rhodanobacteraceae bacterium]